MKNSIIENAQIPLHRDGRYLNDTLTFAGSGFDRAKTVSVAELERSAKPYRNSYSLLTGGKLYFCHSFTGLRLYELLISCGLRQGLCGKTPIKFISKDGNTVELTLEEIKSQAYSCYPKNSETPSAEALPVILAYASDGAPLVGPVGDEPASIKFSASDGYTEATDNTGGPLRLIVGQKCPGDSNAPLCARWVSAIVAGDPDGYRYSRPVRAVWPDGEPKKGGDWAKDALWEGKTLKIGKEGSNPSRLSLKEFPTLGEAVVRKYFAASSLRCAYEGVRLSYLAERYGGGVGHPVTVVGADGYRKHLDWETVSGAIDSLCQPGERREVILAYARDGAPLPEGEGPLQLIVENSIAAWVKNVVEIIIE